MTDASQSRSRPTDPYSRSAGTAAGPAPRPTGTLDPTGLAWFEARGLDAELVIRYGIESATVPGGGDWVSFPCLRDGAVVNHKFRRLDRKDFRQDKGCPQVLWNLDCLGDRTLASHPVIFTEGEVDCLSAIQGGFPRSVSFSAGAPSAPLHGEGAKYASVADALGKLADVRDIILAVDNDGPGLALMADLSVRLGKGRCRYVVYPEGCKDLNDVLLTHGERGVAEALNGAKPVHVAGLFRMSELTPLPEPEPFSTGIEGLDVHYRLRKGDLAVLTGIPGHGKALALDTPIPTPDGWTTMRLVRVGDVLYDERGEQCRVTAATEVMLGRPCYRIRFDDGSQVVADAEHQWLTTSEKARRSALQASRKRGGREETRPRGTDQRGKRTFASVVTTEVIAASLHAQGKRNHQVPMCAPVAGVASLLPVDAYTLGAWLGDGDSAGGRLTCFDEEIVERIAVNGPAPVPNSTAGRFGLPGIKRALRFLGVLDDKHIPELYLNASRGQRWDLLRGLMDTDGSAHEDRTCEFTSCNHRLALGVHELACSLGLKATVNSGLATIDGRVIGPKYRVRFVTGEPVFTVGRKLARQGVGEPPRINARVVVGCESVESVPVRCIQVDSPSHLFLCTRSFIPTHNSTLINHIACQMAELHGWTTCFASFEQHPTQDHRRNLIRWKTGLYENELSHRQLLDVHAWMDARFSFVVPQEDEDADLGWVLDLTASAVCRHGADMVVLDPWNELDHVVPRESNLTQYTGQALRQLRRFAKKWMVHLLVAAHPTKLHKAADGSLPMPTLYDISDSAHFFNKPDVGLIVHRQGSESLLRVAKSRYHDRIGRPGTVTLRLDEQTMHYHGTGVS